MSLYCVLSGHCSYIQLFKSTYIHVCEQLLQIDRINNIFKDHSFGSCGSGFGFEIKEVIFSLFELVLQSFLYLLNYTILLSLATHRICISQRTQLFYLSSLFVVFLFFI